MAYLSLVSPLPHLGRDALEPMGYGYIQTLPPCIEQPMIDLSLEEYTLEVARRYTHPPSSSVISMSQSLTPSSQFRVVIGCHTSVTYNIGKGLWTDQITLTPEEKREVLCMGKGLPWKVITGYVLTDLYTEKTCSHIETTRVQVTNMTPAEIEDYIHREESGYAIGVLYLKGRGALFTSCIEGSYFNALGCSPYVVKNLLKQAGVNDLVCNSR
jgi:predicted house-cleaning NTP pyrophosphatase (Maf/HAM1 superfamily)